MKDNPSTPLDNMTKREEYNLKFYTKLNPFGYLSYILDTNEAVGDKKRLSFIDWLDPVEIEYLIRTITAIQHDQPHDKHFLDDAEIYDVYDVTYSHPYFFVEGVQTIHHDDLKLVLQEWLAFRNS